MRLHWWSRSLGPSCAGCCENGLSLRASRRGGPRRPVDRQPPGQPRVPGADAVRHSEHSERHLERPQARPRAGSMVLGPLRAVGGRGGLKPHAAMLTCLGGEVNPDTERPGRLCTRAFGRIEEVGVLVCSARVRGFPPDRVEPGLDLLYPPEHRVLAVPDDREGAGPINIDPLSVPQQRDHEDADGCECRHSRYATEDDGTDQPDPLTLTPAPLRHP